jgi:hypothetical protein
LVYLKLKIMSSPKGAQPMLSFTPSPRPSPFGESGRGDRIVSAGGLLSAERKKAEHMILPSIYYLSLLNILYMVLN